jgi:2-hydroxy-6-oxonona-2,4-dienedioate hydrolase
MQLPFMSTPFVLQEAHGFEYIAEGPETNRPDVVLLHGMLGDLSNWYTTIACLAEHGFRVYAPVLPVYNLPMLQTNVDGLVAYVSDFIDTLDLRPTVLVGNSLGGHVALLLALARPEDVAALVLAGASGIYEVDMGTSTLRRRDREFIRERAARTFYDPAHATDKLVDEMLALVNNRKRALRLLKMARSAQSETVTENLSRIDAPTLLIWGANDEITPPDVAHEFQSRLGNAELEFIDRCGHAPMIEHPGNFNDITLSFLQRTVDHPASTPADPS